MIRARSYSTVEARARGRAGRLPGHEPVNLPQAAGTETEHQCPTLHPGARRFVRGPQLPLKTPSGFPSNRWLFRRHLVVRVRGSLAEASDAGEDGIGALDPDEWPRVLVHVLDVALDYLFQLLGAGEHAAVEPAPG